ncbi:unnamed protein product [Pleuronectes platessa]|uniref:Uncharacterized protein n=1 Tax=Pleuronectes platessa TaxID=8262 RepID=A0A9N7U5R8_PLEPL|nr:unnamed protein product [Pleuronectes platessa]
MAPSNASSGSGPLLSSEQQLKTMRRPDERGGDQSSEKASTGPQCGTPSHWEPLAQSCPQIIKRPDRSAQSLNKILTDPNVLKVRRSKVLVAAPQCIVLVWGQIPTPVTGEQHQHLTGVRVAV